MISSTTGLYVVVRRLCGPAQTDRISSEMGCHSQPDDRFPRARAAGGRRERSLGSDRGDGDHRVKSRRGRKRSAHGCEYEAHSLRRWAPALLRRTKFPDHEPPNEKRPTWTRKIHEGDLHESDPSGGAGAGEKLTKATDMKATDRRRLS